MEVRAGGLQCVYGDEGFVDYTAFSVPVWLADEDGVDKDWYLVDLLVLGCVGSRLGGCFLRVW